MATRIPYLDEVWNVTTGCGDDMVSPGCLNCYARRMFGRNLWKCRECSGEGRRLMLGVGLGTCPTCHGTGRQDFAPTFHADRLDQPLHWRKPRRIGVSFLGDLFHEAITWDQIDAALRTIAVCRQHTFLLLTKRPERMHMCFTDRERDQFLVDPLPNLHLGVTVCGPDELWKVDVLRQTPAATRWLSLEPLLSPLPELNLTGISWVVLGGETGPGARPMQPEWALGVYRQCKAAGVPFWFKQGGTCLARQFNLDGFADWEFESAWREMQATHELPAALAEAVGP